MKKLLLAGSLVLAVAAPVIAHEAHKHAAGKAATAEAAKDASPIAAEPVREEVTLKGEIIDLVCYIDHEALGAEHAACAKTCIESGLPVGLRTEDGKVYLLVGEHKPANKMLAAYAAKTVTVKGKLAVRDGISMIENVEIVP